jgi:hypothetical protein
MIVDDDIGQVAAILVRAEQSYGGGQAKERIPGWERFYAWRLLAWPELTRALGRAPGITELTSELARLDRAFRTEQRDEAWATFYARELLSNRRTP